MVTGNTLAHPDEPSGPPLLAADVVITDALIKRLKRAGIRRLLIDDEHSRGIEAVAPVSEEVRSQAVEMLKATIESPDGPAHGLQSRQLDQVEHVMQRVLSEVSGRRGLLICLSDLNLYGADRMQHALNVCLVGTAIARQYVREHGWVDYRGNRRDDDIDDRLVKLGIGLLLLDVGMLTVPARIREKGGLLTAEERAIMQQHPLNGVELVDNGEASPLTKVTIAQHHERLDGSGYPRGLRGDDIHDHGQIAAIAETYVSLGMPSGDEPAAMPPHQAYRIILRSRGRLYKAEIVDAFAEAIAPYGPGTTLRLSDGRYGIVERNNPSAPLRPVVRVTHEADGSKLERPLELDLHALTAAITIAEPTDGLPDDQHVSTAHPV